MDVIGENNDGVERKAADVSYDVPRGSIAGHYLELNVLAPLFSAGEESDTPTSKSIMFSIGSVRQRERRRVRPGDFLGSGRTN